MCGFSFTVFLSAFQLFPTAPFHILELGGTTSAAGLFLGFLAYASAFSAPLTGTLGDRIGPRRMLIIASVAITGFSIAYALIPSYKIMLGLVLVHGVFWSGLLTGSAAYMTNILPESRQGRRHRVLGAGHRGGRRGGPFHRLLGVSLRLAGAVPGNGDPQHRDGDHRVAPAAPADRRGPRRPAQGTPRGMARARPFVHALSLFVRLRRHHELHGAYTPTRTVSRRRGSI